MPPRTNNKKKTNRAKRPNRGTATSSLSKALLPGDDLACVHRNVREPWLTDPVCEEAIKRIIADWSLNRHSIVEKLMREFPACVNNQNTLDIIASKGTEYLLDMQATSDDKRRDNAKRAADLINLLELHWIRESEPPQPQNSCFTEDTSGKLRQRFKNLLELDSRLKIVRFFRKRIPCSCLDQVKREAKKEVEEGRCRVCLVYQSDTSLLNCSRCGQVKYCSPEFQRLDWNAHKPVCKTLAHMGSQESPNGKPFAK